MRATSIFARTESVRPVRQQTCCATGAANAGGRAAALLQPAGAGGHHSWTRLFPLCAQTLCGACCGKESVEDHHARLLGGLAVISVKCWPWEGAVALKEVGETMTQYHIVHNWFWLGRSIICRRPPPCYAHPPASTMMATKFSVSPC